MDSANLTFLPYQGDLSGLHAGENHLIFRWQGPGKILASVSRRGNAAAAHLSCDKQGLRHLKTAIAQFSDFAFWLFDWCTMVLAQITVPSVARVVQKCGFVYVGQSGEIEIYARPR